MKTLKKIFAGVALSAAFVGASQAAAIVNNYVLTPSFGPGTELDYSFSDAPGNAGDTFVDNFFLSSVPSSTTDWLAFLAQADLLPNGNGGSSPSVAFTGFSLLDMLNTNYPFAASDFSASAIDGLAYVGSGTYDLQISGTVLADGGSFSGIAASNIPEPQTLALAFAALGGVALIRRKRG